MLQAVWSFVRDETGASAIEYGLIVALIAAALVLVFGLFGESVVALFEKTCSEVPDAAC